MPRRSKTEAAEPVNTTETAAPAKRKAAAKSAPTEEIVLQCAGGEWNVDEIKEQAIAAYVAEGHQRGRISKLSLYVKPEERKAYYVINDKADGSIDLE